MKSLVLWIGFNGKWAILWYLIGIKERGLMYWGQSAGDIYFLACLSSVNRLFSNCINLFLTKIISSSILIQNRSFVKDRI